MKKENNSECKIMNFCFSTTWKKQLIREVIDFKSIIYDAHFSNSKLNVDAQHEGQRSFLITCGLLYHAMPAATSLHYSIPTLRKDIHFSTVGINNPPKIDVCLGKCIIDVDSLLNVNYLHDIEYKYFDSLNVFTTMTSFDRFMERINLNSYQYVSSLQCSKPTEIDKESAPKELPSTLYNDDLVLESLAEAERVGYSIMPCKGANLLYEDEVDFFISGIMPLVWQRVYCSNNKAEGLLGTGWRLPFENYITLSFKEENIADVFYFDVLGELNFLGEITLKQMIYCPHINSWLYWHEKNQIWQIDNNGTTSVYINFIIEGNKFTMLFQINSYGNILEYHYDDLGRLISVDDGTTNCGIELKYQQNTMRILNVTQKHINKILVSYDYDQFGYLAKVTDADNLITHSFEYCSEYDYALCQYTNLTGLIMKFNYEFSPVGFYRVIANSLWGGEKLWGITLVYDYSDNAVLIEHCNKKISLRRWDSHNRIIESSTEGATPIYFEWDEYHMLKKIFIGNYLLSEFIYNNKLQCIKQVLGDSGIRLTNWHATLHLPLNITNPDGGVWNYEYNAQGSIQSITSPNGSQKFFAYNDKGSIIVTSDESFLRNQYIYNNQEQLTEYIDYNYHKHLFYYHSNGWLYKHFDSNFISVSFNFKNSGRIKDITFTNGNTRHFEYNSKGQIINIIDFDNSKYELSYTILGKIMSVKKISHS